MNELNVSLGVQNDTVQNDTNEDSIVTEQQQNEQMVSRQSSSTRTPASLSIDMLQSPITTGFAPILYPRSMINAPLHHVNKNIAFDAKCFVGTTSIQATSPYNAFAGKTKIVQGKINIEGNQGDVC